MPQELNYGYLNKRKLTFIKANIYWELTTHRALWRIQSTKIGPCTQGATTLLEKTYSKLKNNNNGWLCLPSSLLPMLQFKDLSPSQAAATASSFINRLSRLSKPLVLKLGCTLESPEKLTKIQCLGVSSRESDFPVCSLGTAIYFKLSKWF